MRRLVYWFPAIADLCVNGVWRGARQIRANRILVSLPAVVDVRDHDGTGLIEAEEDAPFADT